MVLGPPRKLSVVSRNRRTMERRKTLWLACKVQTERISCNCDFKVEHGGLNDATKHSVTESTELNPGCQQPFLFDKMSSAAKTPAAKKSAAKKATLCR